MDMDMDMDMARSASPPLSPTGRRTRRTPPRPRVPGSCLYRRSSHINEGVIAGQAKTFGLWGVRARHIWSPGPALLACAARGGVGPPVGDVEKIYD